MSLWEQANGYRTVRPVTVSYSELKGLNQSKERDFSEKIEEAVGPKGLGIISISDVPEFSLLRQNLLQLSPMLVLQISFLIFYHQIVFCKTSWKNRRIKHLNTVVLSFRVANHPDDVKVSLEDPDSRHLAQRRQQVLRAQL